MKKLQVYSVLILTVIFLCSIHENSFSQGFAPGKGFAQVDFGIGASTWGIPVYAGLDFGVSDAITIGPRISYRSYSYGIRDYRYNIINLAFRGDYHYSYHIDALPEELDLYGGVSAGYSIWGETGDFVDPDPDSGLILYIQAGARWYFTDSWAANAEVSGGNLSGLEVGLSYRFK